jgi:hypothetical protein
VTAGAYDISNNFGSDVFISKLDAGLTTLLASTYLGGDSGGYNCFFLALDSSGNVYVAGMTHSYDFPVTAGAYSTSNHGGFDVFISRLDAGLTTLLASTYLGGSSSDYFPSIALDSGGNVYVAGGTNSSDFPVTAGAYDTIGDGSDVFISKLDAGLTTLLASTYLGGSFSEGDTSIALDAGGDVYVAGKTSSTDFPVTANAYDTTSDGSDVFISRLDADLTTLLASTYLGGSFLGSEGDPSLALDSSGNVYVAGRTDSDDFPVTAGAYDISNNGCDVFISRLDAGLTTLLASTYLGGGSCEYYFSLALDSSGNVYVAGETLSTDFPVTPGAYDTTGTGSTTYTDFFISKLDENLTTLLASTYLGSDLSEFKPSIALDSGGNVYVAGYTDSTDFPTTAGAYDISKNNGVDVFISKFDANLLYKGFYVSPISGDTTEEGGTATFTMKLLAVPTADVTIPVGSTDTTEGMVSPESLTFTDTNWSAEQTVTVTGVDDDMADGNQSYKIQLGAFSSADGYYNGLDPSDVNVTNIDDETAGFTVSSISGDTTEEGGNATFTVRLTNQPTADVTIPVSSSDTTEGTVSPESLTFTDTDWNAEHTVTVTGVDDDMADGNQGFTIVLGAASSSEGPYDGFDPADVTVTNIDDETAGFIVGSISGDTTEEGGQSTFTARLTSQPTSDVTVPVSSSDTTEGTVSPESLTFTDTNWNAEQTVTVTGVDDDMADGNQSFTIVLGAASSLDTGYDGLDPADVTATNIDDETAGFIVGSISGDTSEAGVTAAFTVRLTSQPTSDVTIAVSSSDTTEGTVSPESLTFTDLDWNAEQTVTVTGVDDDMADGNQSFTIVIGAASSLDTGYDGLDPPDVAVTNVDNDSGNNPPAKPVLLSPLDETTGLDAEIITFMWKECTDYDGDVVSYELHISEDPDFPDYRNIQVPSDGKGIVYVSAWFLFVGVAFAGGLKGRRRVALLLVLLMLAAGMLIAACGGGGSSDSSSISQNVSGLDSQTAYYWKVIATDGEDRVESEAWSFSTQ